MVDTIKFSQMTNGGDLANDDKTPGLQGGANVLFNNPWTFLPPGTTAERPTPSPAVNFRLRFNTSDQLYEYYDSVLGQWTQLQESAFTVGPFVTYTADASLPDAQNLGLLADGILHQTILAGVATIDILSIPLTGTYGGTGINNGALTIDLSAGALGYVMTSDGSGNAAWAPSGYLTDAVLLTPSGNQTITIHDLTLATGSMFATLGSFTSGTAAGGFAGKFMGFATTAASGSLSLEAADNAGDYANILTNASTSAARTWMLPDESGTIALTTNLILDIDGDSGTATPTAGTIVFTGGTTGLTFTGATNTMTLGGTLGFGHGGTNVTAVPTTASASNFAAWDASVNLPTNNLLIGYATTVTAAGTTTLTVASANQQFFTGSTTQTVEMPVTSTLTLGQNYRIVNNSSGSLTINSSGGNNILTMAGDSVAILTCILTSGTTAASWDYVLSDQNEGGGVTSVGTGTGLTGGPITSTGTISFAAIAAHKLWANITGGSAVPTEVSTSTFLQTVNYRIVTGTSTYTPTTGTVFALVEAVGGGGGGGGGNSSGAGNGSAGAGGGGGAYSKILYTAAELGANASVTIGAGGAGGTAGNNAGTAGGNTSFDPAGTGGTITANGGAGGGSAASTASAGTSSPGNGGSASGGTVNIPGSPGGYGWWTASLVIIAGGNGGNASIGNGYGNNIGANSGSAGIGSGNYGGGGDGARAAAGTDRAGGNGGNGVVIITEFIAV